MSFLIDTDIASAHLRGNRNVTNRFLQYNGRLFISTVSLAELKTWIYRKKAPAKYRRGLNVLLRDLRALPVSESVADKAGEVGASLSEQGISIATPDLLIAATALMNDVTLVTHNVKDFERIPHLRLADWLQS